MIKGKYVEVDWIQFLSDIRKLYGKLEKYLNVYEYFNILSINRGGSIPATIISHSSTVKNNIYSIGLKSYEDNTEEKITKINKYQDLSVNVKTKIINNPLLIIDELIDSGETMKYVIEKYCGNTEDIIIGCVYNKNKSFNGEIQKIDKNIEFVWGSPYAKTKWLKMPYEK